jgi:uncharacterized protein YvpB
MRTKRRKRRFITWQNIVLICLAAIAMDVFIVMRHLGSADWQVDPPATTVTPRVTVTPAASAKPTSTAAPAGSAKLTVPFFSQAPFGVWDPLHEDACEETSLLMVKYFNENTNPSKEAADQDIIDLVHAGERVGHGLSITLDQLNRLAADHLGMKTGRIKQGATVEDLKAEISAGRPVIVGAAGKILPNPNFRDGGPVYHMLVLIGYDEQGFITNDPGTSRGKDFRYTFDELYHALHDWNEQDIMQGGKNYLVFD